MRYEEYHDEDGGLIKSKIENLIKLNMAELIARVEIVCGNYSNLNQLQRIFGHACASAELDNNLQMLRKISQIYGGNNLLAITWKEFPTENELLYFNKNLFESPVYGDIDDIQQYFEYQKGQKILIS